jgi:hypothetical protein
MLSDPGKVNAGNSFAEFLLGKIGAFNQRSRWSEGLRSKYFSLYFQNDIRLSRKLTLNVGMRYDPRFDTAEINNKRMGWVPGRQSEVYSNAFKGLLFLGDRGFEDHIIAPDLNNLAPRVGLAYLVFPKTVIRAAYGIFYDQTSHMINDHTASGEPFARNVNFSGPVQLSNPYGSGPVFDPVAFVPGKDYVFTLYSTWAIPGTNIVTAYMQNWNFVIEQQLLGDILVRAAYVGSKGTKLLNTPEVNPAIYGPGATASNYNQRRIYQPIGALQVGESTAWSKYHSMQLTVQKRFSHGFSILANYTVSKSIDICSFSSIEGNTAGYDPFNFNNNRGVSDFDIPQRLVVSGIWEHPKLEKRNLIMKNILGGWQSSFIFTAQSGIPFTVVSGVDSALMGLSSFADLTGVSWRLPDDRPQGDKILRWFNAAAFKVAAQGTIGTGRRNQLRVPGAWNMEYGVFKNFRLAERAKLQFRGEFFNVFNHTRLGAPSAAVTSTDFGRISSADDPRIVQLALKLIF